MASQRVKGRLSWALGAASILGWSRPVSLGLAPQPEAAAAFRLGLDRAKKPLRGTPTLPPKELPSVAGGQGNGWDLSHSSSVQLIPALAPPLPAAKPPNINKSIFHGPGQGTKLPLYFGACEIPHSVSTGVMPHLAGRPRNRALLWLPRQLAAALQLLWSPGLSVGPMGEGRAPPG